MVILQTKQHDLVPRFQLSVAIYSIEDLQLIFDLKQVNPSTLVSVKLVGRSECWHYRSRCYESLEIASDRYSTMLNLVQFELLLHQHETLSATVESYLISAREMQEGINLDG